MDERLEQLRKEIRDGRAAATRALDEALAAANGDADKEAAARSANREALDALQPKLDDFEAEKDKVEKAKEAQRQANLDARLDALEDANGGGNSNHRGAPVNSRSTPTMHEGPGWDRSQPAMLQEASVLEASGEGQRVVAASQETALDMWMASASERAFEDNHPDLKDPLASIRAVGDVGLPYNDTDGGYYIPDQLIPAATQDTPQEMRLLNYVTVIPSIHGEGRINSRADGSASEVSYSTTPTNTIGQASKVDFSARRFYTQATEDNRMLPAPGYVRSLRDHLLYDARYHLATNIITGSASSFTGLDAQTANSTTWSKASFSIANVLGIWGAANDRYMNFPPGGTAWVMTRSTFTNVLGLDITANKGALTASANPRQIQGDPVIFFPNTSGSIENKSSATAGDPVAIYGNFKHYVLVVVGRPTISRRPAVNYEEMATRFRCHYSAAGVVANNSGFVLADAAA